MLPRKPYYPLFADLGGRRCVVVGGGVIAQRKVVGLLRCGANVTVISPAVTRWLAASARRGRIRHVARMFRPSDVRSAWLIYAATDHPAVNAAVFRAATRRRLFANVVDHKPLCSFIAPSIMRRGALTIAVSTGGASPSLARRLRHDLHGHVGPYYVPMLRLLARLRPRVQQVLPAYARRKRYFDRVLNGRPATLVRQGRPQDAYREALGLLTRASSARVNGRP